MCYKTGDWYEEYILQATVDSAADSYNRHVLAALCYVAGDVLQGGEENIATNVPCNLLHWNPVPVDSIARYVYHDFLWHPDGDTTALLGGPSGTRSRFIVRVGAAIAHGEIVRRRLVPGNPKFHRNQPLPYSKWRYWQDLANDGELG